MGACTSKSSNQYKNGYPFKISVQTSKWTQNQHNLFDFESQSTEKKKFDFEKSGKIVQLKSEEIYPIGLFEQIENQNELFKIEFKRDHAMLKKIPHETEENQINHQLWYVVRDQKDDNEGLFDKKHKLQIGDAIKLGRANLKVRDLVIFDENNPNQQNNHDIQEDNPTEFQVDLDQKEENSFATGDKHCCRICLSEGSTLENPLISPCQCSGSMKYLHLKCIQKWVERQLKTRNFNNIIVYFWKRLKCELCKIPYKTEFQFQNHVYNIIDIPKPKGSYVMLQLKSSDKKQERGIYVVDLEKRNEIKIGRTQECDVKLNDISVSRIHAILHVQKQELLIEDCGSKFGTLIYLQDKLKINPKDKKKYQIQCGRTLLTLECQRKTNKNNQLDQMIQYPSHIQVKKMNKKDIEKELQRERQIEQMKQEENTKGLDLQALQQQDNSMIGIDFKEKGIFTGNNGKQGVELDDIVIYDMDEKKTQQKVISNNNLNQNTNAVNNS